MRRLLVVLSLFLMIPGVASAGGGGNTSQCPGFAKGATISMLDSCFSGAAHFAPSDTTLTISNDGQIPHTFTAVDGSFDTGQLQPGQTFEIAVDEPGVIEVFCTLHGTAEGQGMAGVLVVGKAEPLPVSAPLNLAAIKQTVAEENESLAEVLGRQADTIENLGATQTELIRSLGQEPGASAATSTQSPTIVTIPGERDAQGLWVSLTAGIALGLASAALLTVDRSKRRRESAGRMEGFEPSLES
jgi:plastocyanin